MYGLLFSVLSFAAEYETWGFWRKDPRIIYCKDSGVKLEHVKDAIDYWYKKGYKTSELIIKDTCDTDYKYSYIKIVKPVTVNSKINYAHTDMQISSNRIDYAVIEVTSEGSLYYETILHEMGHALGIKHVDDKQDIMYHYHLDNWTNL